MAAFHAGVEKHKTEYEQKTARQKYGKSQAYAEFRQAIFVRAVFQDTIFVLIIILFLQEVTNPEAAMPPVTDFIPKGEPLRVCMILG